MSLPIPSTSGAALDPKQLQAMDAPLIALTNQCGGDLRRLMFAYFSFLHRRTDFYLVPHEDDVQAGKPASMGFKEGDAEKLLISAFRQFPLRRIPKGGAVAPPTAAKAVPKKNPAIKSSASTTPATKEEASQETTSKEPPIPTKNKKTSDEGNTGSNNLEGVEYNEEGKQIPMGNGGSTKRYKWTQTIDECSVLVGVPKELRGKDLAVTITPTSLSVKSKKAVEGEDAPRTFVEGKLVEKVRPDESTWTVEGGVVIVTLDKWIKTFWPTIIQGDETIDTELVDSRRRVGEYDDATQAYIRQIIFDQEQYHKGLPSSDELIGEKKVIPPLPKGVEYIDKKKLDEVEKKAKAAKK